MNPLLKMLMLQNRYMAPAGEGGDDGGGKAGDRGDDFQPLDDDAGDEGDDKGADDADDDGDDKGADEEDDAEKDIKKAKDEKDEGKKKAAEKDEGKKQGHMVPKNRLDQEIKARKQVEEKLAAALKGAKKDAEDTTTATLEGEIKGLEDKYDELIADGDTKKAAEVMRQIRTKERQAVELQSERRSERDRALAVEQIRMDSLVARLEEDFEILNPDSDDYDQDTVDEVMLLRKGFEAGGLPSSDALAKAVKYVLGEPPKKGAEEKKGLGAERRTTQTKKNLDADKRMPPRTDKAGVDSDKKGEKGKVDVSQMTEEEINALPASTKARLRGDHFAGG